MFMLRRRMRRCCGRRPASFHGRSCGWRRWQRAAELVDAFDAQALAIAASWRGCEHPPGIRDRIPRLRRLPTRPLDRAVLGAHRDLALRALADGVGATPAGGAAHPLEDLLTTQMAKHAVASASM